MSEHVHFAENVGAYLLGALPPDEAEAFETHLRDCPECRHDVEELRVAADALPVSVPSVAPPPALKQRIMAVVESEAELLAAAGRRTDVPEPAAPPRRRERRSWRLRPAFAALGAAALLAIGVAAGALLPGGDGARTVVASSTAPGAHVELEVGDDASTLVARDMPAPPQGRIYQVWLKRPGSDPEPTSVLWSTRADGSAEVAVPGSLDGVEAVLVTDEPEGGSDVPSKEPVIIVETA